MKSGIMLSVAVALGLFALGCGGGKTAGGKDIRGAKVKGRLVQNGSAFKARPMEEVQITFFEDGKDPKDRVESVATLAEDGTFLIEGPTNNGIPPGEYKISLLSQIYGGDGTDRFENSLSVEKTPIKVSVGPEDGQLFVVDVAKRSAKKQ